MSGLVPDQAEVGAATQSMCPAPSMPSSMLPIQGTAWDGTARDTVRDYLRREQHELIERLAQVHKDLKEVDTIAEEHLQFFLRNRYRW